MNYLVQFFGILIGGMSLWGIFAPQALMGVVVRTWQKPWGMAFAVVVRLIMGAALILAAETTRYPLFFELFGYLVIAAAIGIVLLGRNRVDRIIDYWQRKSTSLLRSWLVLGVALGAFFVYCAR